MGNALIRPQGANTAIGALVVEGGTPRRTAIREEPEPQAQQPQYTHGFLWNAHDLSDHGGFSNTACWGLTISPVPGIPLREFENHEALRTIKANSGLFQVNFSLNIDQFQDLLVGHPNQALIDSDISPFVRGTGHMQTQNLEMSGPVTQLPWICLQRDQHQMSILISSKHRLRWKWQLEDIPCHSGLSCCLGCTLCLPMQYLNLLRLSVLSITNHMEITH